MNRLNIRIILLLLTAILCVTRALAHDFCVNGIYYDKNATEAAVTFRGSTYSYYDNEYSGDVVIPSTVTYNGTTYIVTSIGGNAFRDCSKLTSITIPNSVTSIGDYAFYNIDRNLKLTSVDIPNSVTYIGNFAFYNRWGLTSIDIPNSVTYIGNSAFYNCSGLTSITIPNSVTYIGNEAFCNCGLNNISVDSGNDAYDSRENCNAIIHTASNSLVVGCNNTIIPNTVTSIGEYAFSNCGGLTSVNIPNSVTTIGDHAFHHCSGLTSVIIPNSVTSIGKYAFTSCSGLTSITIPNSVTTISDGAFEYCEGLTSIDIPNSVTTIGNDAFSNCSGLTSVNIPNSVTTIGGGAFGNCFALTSIDIPNSVTTIGNDAFWQCSKLTSVTIPNSVTYIGDYAFSNCSGLTSIDIPNSVTTIGDYAFEYCSGLTGSLTIPNSVTSIGDNAFQGCTALNMLNFNAVSCDDFKSNKSPFRYLNISTINFGDEVQRIPAYFADSMTKLTQITIPNSVTSIGGSAFYNCSGLTGTLTIPNSVTSIGEYAFQGCTALDTLYFNAISCDDFTSSSPFCNNISTINFGEEVQRIPAFFAYGLTKLTSVTIPNSVTSIGSLAFEGCSGLTGSLTIPNSVTSIGGSAFYNCSGLTSVTIGKSVTSIGNYAFQGCTALDTLNFNAAACKDFSSTASYRPFYNLNISTINFGEEVQKIPAYLAYGFTELTNVTIPNSVTTIGNYAFYECSSLTGSLTIPNSVTSIGKYAFDGCTALDTLNFNAVSCSDFSSDSPFYNLNISTINFGEEVQKIPAYLASGLAKLTSVTIPNSVTSIGKYAFEGCRGLTASVTIPNSVTSISDYAFSGCNGLTSVAIGNSVTSIGDGAFEYCRGLTNVTIPNSVTSICYRAFYNCSGLTGSLTIPNSVTSIGEYAFQGCTALDTLNFNAVSCADFSSTINRHPFYGLNISTINIGDEVMRIPNYFAYLPKLTDLTIGKSVSSIGIYAFTYCSGLLTVTSLRPDAVLIPSPFSSSTYSNATLIVPVGSYLSYRQTDTWNRFNKIKEPVSVDSVVLNYDSLSIYLGDSVNLAAVIQPTNANQQVVWTSSDSSIASVDSDGKVTGLNIGDATITATSCDGTDTKAQCFVTVLPRFKLHLDTLTHIRGEAAELVEVPLSFFSRNPISAIQFDVSLPSCASFGFPEMRVNESRLTSSHSFSYNTLYGNSYRVLIASPTSQVLNGNDGPLVYLKVLLSKAVYPAGDYYITVSNIIAAGADETRYSLPTVQGIIRYYYIVGDVNADVSVDIADYMATASKILGRSPSPFYSDAADVDANSSINVTDLVGIVNISLGIKPITLRYAPRHGSALDWLTCEPLDIVAGGEGEITLNLDAGYDFAAFQMDLSLPQGLTLKDAVLGNSATELQLTWATLPDGRVRLLASSFSDAEVMGECPGLLTLKFKADESFVDSSIEISEITFADRNLTSHTFDDMEVDCYGATAVRELDGDSHIYVEGGMIIVETPMNGKIVVSDISGHTRVYPVTVGRNEIAPWTTGILMIKFNNETLKINLK